MKLLISAYSGMEIRQQIVHLLLIKAAHKGRHIALARNDRTNDLRVSRRSSAGQLATAEEVVQIRRRRLEGQIVVDMAVRAAGIKKLLACGLLGSEVIGAASGDSGNERDGGKDFERKR
jgi:hypothetical protein